MIKYVDYDIVFSEVPDEVTLAITLSNCPNNCTACHSPQLKEDVGQILTEDALSTLLKKYGKAITCVCFMGGDAVVEKIQQFARFIHETSSYKTAWYSGRELLPKESNFFDYIKLGAYIEKCGGLTCQSTNQKMYKMDNTQVTEDITYRFWKESAGRMPKAISA